MACVLVAMEDVREVVVSSRSPVALAIVWVTEGPTRFELPLLRVVSASCALDIRRCSVDTAEVTRRADAVDRPCSGCAAEPGREKTPGTGVWGRVSVAAAAAAEGLVAAGA